MHLRKQSDTDLNRSNPIIFVRHAQSEGQVNPGLYRTIGDRNLALTSRGVEQAKAASQRLADLFHKAGWEKPIVLSAESLRTRATADEIKHAFQCHGVIIEPRLNKQSFGKFDGLLTGAEKQQALPDLYRTYKENEEKLGKLAVTPPEGESIIDVINRISEFMKDAANSGRPIIAVTHGLQMVSAEKIAGDLTDQWLLDAQDSIQNVEILTFFPDN